jgi:hypothetical protein
VERIRFFHLGASATEQFVQDFVLPVIQRAVPHAKKGPVPSDGVVLAVWPVRLSPRSVILIK